MYYLLTNSPESMYYCFMSTQKVFEVEEREQVKAIVGLWVRKIGKKTAAVRLVSGGVPIATAQKLAGLKYPWTPKDDLCEVILKIVGKDGFKLSGKKAS